ncbi:MAG: hypothetical protein LAQ69_05950 [Acidobacteriia bacterium]|nr:hypothetical protein [Terriglobia bacterium]
MNLRLDRSTFKLLVLLLCGAGAARCQFSPGPLSKAHHTLDGPTHCTNCHLAGGGQRKFKCLSCHADVRQRLADNRGLHPSLVGKGRPDEQCAKCHSEHNGENFVPIRWDVSKEEFDHRKAGYPLEGGHVGLKCERCHNPERIPAAARKGILMKDLKRTYLGLNRECMTCHQDEHRGQLGTSCERCHAVGRWKDVTLFDHSTTKFRLTGAHEKTPCQKCHFTLPAAGASKPYIRYTGIAFAQCGSCHKDPHRAAFAAPCSSCHNDVAWKPAHGTTVSFDHSKTRYPLLGKHDGVACDKCHRTSDFKAPVAHEQCASCHKDIHGGQLAKRPDRGECGSCHTVEGWKPSTFTAAAHANSAYPLLGKHLSVTCDKCHPPAGAATRYQVSFALCADCHRDPHAGQFPKSKCEDCHTVDRFQPARFTLARHNQTRFPLQEAHVAVACSDCHMKTQSWPVAHVAYRFTDLSCTGCHQDPHQRQFHDSRCEDCHNQQAWRDVNRFDHSKTRFVLTGGHRGVACDRCHRLTPLSTGLTRAVFHNAPTACDGCHEDVHFGQFLTATQKPECGLCHNVNRWKAALFDHEKTRFPLTGAHAMVGCRDCHKNQHEVSGRVVLFYKPTPTECSGCHGPKISN